MSLKYFLIFATLAVLVGATAVINRLQFGWGFWILIYFASNFVLLAIAYAGLGPRLFGKNNSGQIPLHRKAFLAPYLLLNELSFQLFRLRSSEPAVGEAAPNLYFGRRLIASEATTFAKVHGWQGVLDLTCEFSEARPLRQLANYRSVPVLDATPPDMEVMAEAVAWISEQVAEHPIYVHCALGHGRTATIVIAYLIKAGKAASIDEALEKLALLRPGVDINASQRAALSRFLERNHDSNTSEEV
jgi:hypothetical protein